MNKIDFKKIYGKSKNKTFKKSFKSKLSFLKKFKIKNKSKKKKKIKKKEKIKDYVFGYGSIINTNSRNYTKEKFLGKSIPVILKKNAGYKRNWVTLGNSKHGKFSFLGISKSKENADNINGIIFPINQKDIKNFDKRENPDYYRRKIDLKFFKHYFKNPLPKNINIYTYVIKKKFVNNNKCPILQTYLDIVIQGCLEYDKKFAKMFLDTTDNWKPIYNDRKNKIYSSFDKNIKLNYKQIDNILKNNKCF